MGPVLWYAGTWSGDNISLSCGHQQSLSSNMNSQLMEICATGLKATPAPPVAAVAPACSRAVSVHICNIYNIYYLHIVLCCAAPGRDWRLVE